MGYLFCKFKEFDKIVNNKTDGLKYDSFDLNNNNR